MKCLLEGHSKISKKKNTRFSKYKGDRSQILSFKITALSHNIPKMQKLIIILIISDSKN